MDLSTPLDPVSARVIRVPLDCLDRDPQWHRLSFGRDPKPLEESIARIGLLHPPVVCAGAESRFTVVTGFLRIQAMASAGEASIPCAVLSFVPDSLEKLRIGFWENLTSRGFNLVEKALAVERFHRLVGTDELLGTILPALGLHPHARELERMIRIARLPEPLLEALHQNRVFPEPALFLQSFPPGDRTAVLECMLRLNLNLNQQKEFLESVLDMSLRDGVSAPTILAEEEFTRILDHPAWSVPQKAQRVRRALKERLYPRLSRAERAFEREVQALRLPPFVRVSHAPYFETERLRVDLDVKDIEEAKHALKRLNEEISAGRLERLAALCRNPGDAES